MLINVLRAEVPSINFYSTTRYDKLYLHAPKSWQSCSTNILSTLRSWQIASLICHMEPKKQKVLWRN